MSDVGPWTKYDDAAPPKDGPWTKFKAAEGKDAGLYSSFLSGFASDKQEQVRMLADRLFPNEPVEESVKRFSVQDGAIVYRGDDGNTYKAMPEGGMRGMAGDVLQGAGKMLPAGGGAVAGAVTLPLAATGVGIAGTMAAAGGGAAAGEYARQKLGDILFGRASTNNINAPQIVREGAEGALGQGIGLGMTGLINRGAVRDIERFNPVATQQAYDDAAAVGPGFKITPAEATGLATLKGQQKRLTNITASSNEMSDFIAARDNLGKDYWRGFIDFMSKAQDAEEVGVLVRGAAKDVLNGMRQKTLAEARPFYQAAYEAGDKIMWTPELERLSSAPSVKRAMAGAVNAWRDNAIADGFGAMNPGALVDKGMLKFKGGELPAFPNLQFWDYTKRMLDQQVQAAQSAGLNDKARTLTKLVQQLRGELDNIGPAEYKQARAIYGDGAERLETAMESALGILANSKDVNVLRAAQTIFDPKTRSPAMVTRLRTAIEGQDPQAWQAVKRLYVNDITQDALRAAETAAGDGVLNPLGKIVKAFSDERLRENLRAALAPDEWQRMNELLVGFRRASSVPALRSDTAFVQLTTQEAEEQARPMVAKLIRNINPAELLRNVSDWMTSKNVDRQAQTMVKLITSGDPEVIQSMRELRKLSNTQRQTVLLLGHLIERGTVAGAEAAVTSGAGN